MAADSFHDRCMAVEEPETWPVDLQYGSGFNDACHACAEIAAEADAEIASLKRAIRGLHDEIGTLSKARDEARSDRHMAVSARARVETERDEARALVERCAFEADAETARLREALRAVLNDADRWLAEPGWGTWPYMEGEEIYRDKEAFKLSVGVARAALAGGEHD